MNSTLINTRKKIFKALKERAYSFEGRISKELKNYRKNHERASKRTYEPSSENELLKSVLSSDVIYISDYHTFEQNIRGLLRLMRMLGERNIPYVLAVEMIGANHQDVLDAFYTGFITEYEFLEDISYTESWAFPWANYKLIFDEAKKYLIPVYGINTEGTLLKRDRFAAQKIKKIKSENPDHKVLVFYGEYHVVENKLPKILHKILPLPYTIIHQNLDDLYWSLVENNHKDEIVKFSPYEFCINSSPPWVKYDSMIYWFENTINDPDYNFHELIISTSIKKIGDDSTETFTQILVELTENLNLNIPHDYLFDFNLYDFNSLSFIEEKLNELENQTLKAFYNHLIITNRSFRIPDSTLYYFASYSLNRLSYIAGIHIYHSFNMNMMNSLNFLSHKGINDKFSFIMFEHMFAYFFSKMINPHRKCDMYLNLQKSYLDSPAEENNTPYDAIKILDGTEPAIALKNQKLQDIYQVAISIGHILGEYLYDDILENPFYVDKNLSNDFLSLEPNYENCLKIFDLVLYTREYQKHIKRYF